MDAIHLEGLSFYAYHGVYDEEAKLGQRFVVDLTCHLDLTEASLKDDLALTACYATLAKTVEGVVTNARYFLIERLAGAIAESVFAAEPRIERLTVRVHKPGAPLPVAAGRVYVEISRERP